MDRESYYNCCSLVKIPRQSYEKFWSSHFVDYIDKELSYSKFFKRYLLPNHPFMFSRKFTRLDMQKTTLVPVANSDVKEYNANPKQMIYSLLERIHPTLLNCSLLSATGIFLNVYTTPIFFSSDWFNKYWDTLEVDNYRFVYMEPKDSWTPFHTDVFRKKWLLFPPGQEEFLQDSHGNLEDNISINHNWLNGCNVYIMWQFLYNELSAVQREIEEWSNTWRYWYDKSRFILKKLWSSCSGIDYREFASFLKIVADNRMSFLSS
uniref:Uncharacterized protein n=1 Tax=Oncorhynchus tshawytscha TaxID=74940 RepID=A0A8C8GEY7_ONCTS